MFTGEIEFSDIPLEGSNVSFVLGWGYFLTFLLMVVLVLMNLLNALAISDISKIVDDSRIEYMLSNIRDVNNDMDKFVLNPLNIMIFVVQLPWIVCCLPCIYGAMFCFEIEDLKELARPQHYLDKIDVDSGVFKLNTKEKWYVL